MRAWRWLCVVLCMVNAAIFVAWSPVPSRSQREGAPRDVLLLDIALDSYFRLCIERSNLGSMR